VVGTGSAIDGASRNGVGPTGVGFEVTDGGSGVPDGRGVDTTDGSSGVPDG